MTEYENCLQNLYSRRHPKRGDLRVLQKLLKQWNSPHLAYPVIHVGGTNGKGQVSGSIARALTSAGYKTGLFTSPHLFEYTERIQIDGEEIPRDKIVSLYREMLEQPDSHLLNFFEATCGFGFRYFQEEQVDVAVVEVGLGGLLDSTNLVEPILAVITSLGLDHTDYLGDTLEEIAAQKAGIIKPGIPVVVGPSAQLPPVLDRAKEMKAPLHLVSERPSFYGDENRAIARVALEVLQKTFPMSQEAVSKGVAYRPPCRFEKRGDIILDVAHNPKGLARLVDALDQFYPNVPTRFVMGLKEAKDLIGCIDQVAPRATHIHFIEAPTFAPYPRSHIPSCALSLEPSIKEGMRAALAQKGKDELIVVCGSFYLMKEVSDCFCGSFNN